MKKILVIVLCITLILSFSISIFAENDKNNAAEQTNVAISDFEVNAKSAILMEAGTGKILFMQNETEKSSPASVTKIMTLLIIMEAVADGRISLTDKVTVSDSAASKGGSQVFLEEGEEMTVEELIKCTVIASANDAAVALAEYVGGSEKIFVSMMNKRAEELGMENTNFENATGLDDTTSNHVTCAKDIAIMSKELIKYELILKYSSLWQDTIRNGEFTLTNTNRLVRYYDGCNGLKTGSTDKAGYCISATAKRGDMQLIAVIMGAPTRDIRNAAARSLLDFGFSNYTLYKTDEKALENISIYNGVKDSATLYSAPFTAVIPKNSAKKVELVFDIPKNISAPVTAYGEIGKIVYKIGEEEIGTSKIYLIEDVDKITFIDLFFGIFSALFKG